MSKQFELTIDYFNLSKICTSGQVFRMYEREQGLFDVYSADKHVRVLAEDAGGDRQKLTFYCAEEDLGYWKKYFDLERDYAGAAASVDAQDAYLTACRDYGCSIRILHQNIWEMMITFIISQQKQIPSIRKCVEGLSAKLGKKMKHMIEYGEPGKPGNPQIKSEEHEWYAFPEAAEIAAAGPEGVKGLSLGYRERYLYETSRQYLERGISDDELEAMDYAEAKKYLLSFTGIGEKVANCILLFGAAFVDAFPIDTHIKDILYREYYLTTIVERDRHPQEKLTLKDYERLTEEHFGRYSGYRGIVQQWIFANEVK